MSLSVPEKRIIWMQLPPLHVVKGYHTVHPGESPYRLDARQVLPWASFGASVKGAVRPVISGEPSLSEPATVATEEFGVGNETGLQGRFCHHIGHVLSSIFFKAGLKVRFADFQYGVSATEFPRNEEQSNRKGKKSKRRRRRNETVPDVVLVLDEDHKIQVVGELKTWWTFERPKRMSQEDFLARQVAFYMDRHRCRYGFFSTYNQTWFLRREPDGYHFRASVAIEWGQYATKEWVSLKVCFLFLAIKATKEAHARFPFEYGRQLTKKGYKPPRKRKLSDILVGEDTDEETVEDERENESGKVEELGADNGAEAEEMDIEH